MNCRDGFIGNVPPGADGAGNGGTPDFFFRATKTDSAQVITDNLETTVSFNSEDYDQGGIYVPSTLQVPATGLYVLEATVDITFQAAGFCRMWFDLAGTGVLAESRKPIAGAGQHVFNFFSLIHLVNLTLVQVHILQVTGLTASIATGVTRYNGAQLRAGALSGP